MAENNRPSFFKKILAASEIQLDRVISKARSEISEEEDEAFYRKSVYRDMSYQTSSQGWLDRGTKIGFAHLKQMALKDTIVAAIIQTRQNQGASHSKSVKEASELGYRIKRKNEEQAILEIMEELFGPEEDAKDKIKKLADKEAEKNEAPAAPGEADPMAASSDVQNSAEDKDVIEQGLAKAEGDLPFNDPGPEIEMTQAQERQAAEEQPEDMNSVDSIEGKDLEGEPEPGAELSDRQKRRMAKEELRKRDREKIESLAEFISNCGYLEDRPFETRRWDFDAFLRAIIRDSLTYDLFAIEMVPDQAGKLSYFVPIDGATIRLTTPEFNKYRTQDLASGYDILYPEKELEALHEKDAFKLDEEKLKEGDYKFCQVVRGRIERGFTADEVAIGMRNPTADIYSNGYSISELELLVGAVSSHIFTENYNHSYYTQGFSAKGILHIKAPINRRKLETIRMQWKHMLSGARNSFQTPIFAGMDEVQWIPLTQNHSDMEFSNWMNYLIKIICAIFQIDPAEIGFAMRDEGGRGGGGLSGDNTEEKMENSKDKGLKPLMRYIENFLNKEILSKLDDDFIIEFSGLHDEDAKMTVERQASEVKFKKSVNEIREEDGLAPIDGADDLILDATYLQWFTQFHPDGQKLAEQNSMMQQAMNPGMPGEEDGGGEDFGGGGNPPPMGQPPGAGGPPPPAFGKSRMFLKARRAKAAKQKKPTIIEYYIPEE